MPIGWARSGPREPLQFQPFIDAYARCRATMQGAVAASRVSRDVVTSPQSTRCYCTRWLHMLQHVHHAHVAQCASCAMCNAHRMQLPGAAATALHHRSTPESVSRSTASSWIVAGREYRTAFGRRNTRLPASLRPAHRSRLRGLGREQDESVQLRCEVADLQAKLQHALADATVAQRAVVDANKRASAEAAKAVEEAKTLAAACEEARRDAKEQAGLATRLAGELGAVQRQADEYLGLIKKRSTASERSRVGTAKSHAN